MYHVIELTFVTLGHGFKKAGSVLFDILPVNRQRYYNVSIWLYLGLVEPLRKRYYNVLYRLWKRSVGINRKQTLSNTVLLIVSIHAPILSTLGSFGHVLF